MANSKKKKKINSKIKKRRLTIIKWTSLFILTLTAVVLFLLSDIFNIKEINVVNNNKISSEDIIKLSGIQINKNIFKFLAFNAEDNIKTNPYIDDVKIHRKMDRTIEIKVLERTPAYIIKKEENYVYVNNQGYILEINSEKLEVPQIDGFITEEMIPGERLNSTDLKKLNNIMQIIQSAKNKDVFEKITSINIESDLDYIIIMELEQKTIHLGNFKNINDKISKIIPVLEDNIGIPGEIYAKDIDKIYFRGDV